MKESFKFVEWTSTYKQDEDCNGRADHKEQYITLSAVDNGNCEHYLVIETERWAIDIDEIDKFCDELKKFIHKELIPKKKK
jgi:hypothetical protein